MLLNPIFGLFSYAWHFNINAFVLHRNSFTRRCASILSTQLLVQQQNQQQLLPVFRCQLNNKAFCQWHWSKDIGVKGYHYQIRSAPKRRLVSVSELACINFLFLGFELCNVCFIIILA